MLELTNSNKEAFTFSWPISKGYMYEQNVIL